MPDTTNIDRLLKTVAEQSIDKSSQVLSKMLGCAACIDLKRVVFEDVTLVTQGINEHNTEVIAATIDLVGDAPFRFLFWVPVADAFKLTDLFLRQEVGLTQAYDEYTSSTVQEIANIISSAVTNVFVANFQVSMRPQPPFVARDYSGSIFEEFIMGVAMERNDILLIESRFQIAKYAMDCRMYLLPLVNSDQTLSLASHIEEARVSKRKIKVLVIDDLPANCLILQSLLDENGYEALTVSSAQDGLIRMAQEHFDLILCDYNMPEMNGEVFIERVRQDSILKNAIIIIVTSDEDKDIKVRLLNRGANDFIHKGASGAEILARIAAHVNARANVNAQITALWTGALLKVFNGLSALEADLIENKDKTVLLGKIKQMQHVMDPMVSMASSPVSGS